MIGPKDASKLALTKLKTRKVRLFVTLIISSILFSLLMAVSFTVRGIIKSEEKFSNAGFGHRYLVSAYANSDSFALISDKKLIAKAEALQAQLTKKKTAAAENQGLQYDPKSDTPYVMSYDGPNGKEKQLNTQVPAVAKLIAQNASNNINYDSKFLEVANKAGASATYQSLNINGAFSSPYVAVLNKGKEDFSQQQSYNYQQPKGIQTLPQQWQVISRGLMKPFILQGQNLDVGSDGSIPIVAPYSAAEQILGLSKLPASADAEAKLNRLKEVRTSAAGYSFNVCYRNSTSNDDLQSAISQQQDIAANKSDKDYQPPTLIMDLPKTGCGAVRITSDKRTIAERAYAQKQAAFDRQFGKPDAKSTVLKMRIVGLNSDPDYGSSISVAGALQSFLNSTLGFGWFSPLEATKSNKTLNKIFLPYGQASAGGTQAYYAEFPSGDKLKKFIDGQNCSLGGQDGAIVNYSDSSGQMISMPGSDFNSACHKAGKYFSVSPFGSSSTAIDDFKKGFGHIFRIATLVVAAIAALIMMGTVGRIIADSRRETAVFRAIGAKRLDIAQIYITYTLFLALLIAAISLVLGLALSTYLNHRYADELTVNSLIAFNSPDLSQKFSLTSFYIKDLLYVIALITGAAILATIGPLITNVRRNPIRDMRDER